MIAGAGDYNAGHVCKQRVQAGDCSFKKPGPHQSVSVLGFADNDFQKLE